MSSNIQAIVMPKLGLSMTEGIVAQWRVSVGAKVSPGDVIADIETSKITNELEVHTTGMIRGELAESGVELPVGALLGVVAEESATDDEIAQFIANFVPQDMDMMDLQDETANHEKNPKQIKTGEKPERLNKAGAGVIIPDSLKGEDDDSAVSATHLARKLAIQSGINLTKITGTGRRGRVSKKDIENAVRRAGGNLSVSMDKTPVAKSSIDDAHIPATPLARRLAKQAGINLASVTPTGSHGRVTRLDIENVIAASGAVSNKQTKVNAPAGGYEEVSLTAMRRVIAGRLVESKQNAPHFRLTIDANIDQMLKLRADLNQDTGDAKISINDLLIKAVAEALIKVPDVNIQFDGDIIRRFADADVAVAVALDEGLLTPIIRSANRKSILEISREMTDLGKRAKAGSLMADEFEGGTFTLSNLGMFGVKAFDAIINPPQAAILAVGAGEKRCIYSGAGEISATIMTATISCDHRVIDGATGARFMQTAKEIMEHPYKMLMSGL